MTRSCSETVLAAHPPTTPPARLPLRRRFNTDDRAGLLEEALVVGIEGLDEGALQLALERPQHDLLGGIDDVGRITGGSPRLSKERTFSASCTIPGNLGRQWRRERTDANAAPLVAPPARPSSLDRYRRWRQLLADGHHPNQAALARACAGPPRS